MQPQRGDQSGGAHGAGGAGRILVVCTANICRSPLAAAVLDDELAGRATPIRITSAGTHARAEHVVDPRSAAQADTRGLDLAGHRARLLDATLVRDSDLVLTMTRTHRAAAIALVPRHLDRVFTWLEFAALARWVLAEGDEPGLDGTPRTAARVAHLARPRAPFAGPQDIADPYGRSTADYRTMARQVVDATRDIARLVTAQPNA